ncbi:MAG TPA: FmdB family zinc ribbon protein [Jatrophihabitans sp.]|nr:FmdB family zinc ribbon protein [Jatrophihabitans sp.]
MPTYQYACTSDECGLRFERVQAFTDEAISACPDCDQRVRKVYGSVGVVFKGSGFYRNDSRTTKAESGTSGSSSDSTSSSSSSSDGAGKSTSTSASTDGGGSSSSKTGTSPAPAATERKASAPVAS